MTRNIDIYVNEYKRLLISCLSRMRWDDFRAEYQAIKDKKDGMDKTEFLAALASAANELCFAYYKADKAAARAFEKVWREVDGFACDNLKGECLQAYLRLTD